MRKNIFNLFLVISLLGISTTVAGQPKFHTVPKQNMQGLNFNNPNSSSVFNLPIQTVSGFNLAIHDNPSSLSEFIGQGYATLCSAYPGFTPVFAHQIVNDKSGNLLFFIVDNFIYNKNGFGFEIDPNSPGGQCHVLKDGDEWGNYNPYDTCCITTFRIHNDIIIVPVPNSCNEFYIFFATLHCQGQGSSPQDPRLFYKKLTYVNENEIYLTTEQQINLIGLTQSCYNGSGFSMDITSYENEFDDYLLIISWGFEYIVLEIGETINQDQKYFTHETQRNDSILGIRRPDAVLTHDNAGNIIFLNSSLEAVDNNALPTLKYNKFPRNFNDINTNTISFGEIYLPYSVIGLEISPNRKNLYFTMHDLPNIFYLDIEDYIFNSDDFPTTYNTLYPTGDYHKTQLETFGDNKIYAIDFNSVTEKGTYTSINNPNSPTSTTFSYYCFDTCIVDQTFIIDCSDLDDEKRFVFNHQTDNSDYETGYPIFASDQPDWGSIGSNVTWSPGAANNPFGSESGIVYLDEDFVIPTGKYVKLSNMEFYFANGKKAIVNIGSTLRLEGTKLSAETTCTPTAMWNGVYIEGNPGVIQNTANQGTLSMASGSEISNAITAVTVEGGAICKIYAGDFINNKTGIYFYPHTYAPMPNYNASLVQLANFTINGALNNGNTPSYMIYMNGVKGINITSCNFLNSRGSDIAAASRGYAIRSNSTNFKLSNCELEGWNYGCYSTLGTPRILNNEFAGNFKSVYSASGVSVEITGNDFNGEYDFASGTATPYSVHVLGNGVNNTLYKFEENTIQNGVVGVQFNNLGPNAVKVKDNVFLNISGYTQSCAAVAIGKNSNFNAGLLGDQGLEFRCNNFDDNPYALSVIDGNMRKYQGEFGASSGSDYAGNAFDHYGTNLERDFYVKVPINSYWEIPLYEYYSHSDDPHNIQFFTQSKVNEEGEAAWFQETDCSESISGGGVIIKGMSVAEGSEIIEQTDTELLLKEFELEEMIDEGNTFYLLSEVETMNNNNTIDVAESIAELDGFISDEVAITYMQNNSGNQFAKANALLKNSPLPASVRGKIDEMDMSPSLKHFVKQHQNGSNARDLKQSEIAGLKQHRGLLVNELVVSAILNDSVPNEKVALKQFLTNDDNLQSKFHLFNLNILSKEYLEAHATLESIKQMIQIEDVNYVAEMEDFIELQHIIVEIEAGNISIADAAANNLDLLNFIADEESCPGQATAQLILSQAGIRSFEEVIKLPEPSIENKSLAIQKGNTDNFSTNDDIINVYPNPTAGNIYVEYAFLSNADNGFIEIYGITGNLVYRTELSQPIGVFTYKEKLPSGNYIIKVGNNFSQKITVQ